MKQSSQSAGSRIHDYTRHADAYDKKRFSGASGEFLARRDSAIIRDLVRLSGAKTVLDAPVGTGRVIEYLANEHLEITGCDGTPRMLEVAKAKEAARNARFLCANIAQMPLASDSFDCAVSLRFFHLFHPEDRTPFFREFARVIRPGGYMLCSFTNGWYAGGWNWVKKFVGPHDFRRKSNFLYPGELRRLFPGWRICAVRGNFLPFQWRVSPWHPAVERGLSWIVSHFPFNRLCWEQFYLLQKPAS